MRLTFSALFSLVVAARGLRIKTPFSPRYFAEEYESMAIGGTQENMLRDAVRVSSYQRAIAGNPTDFRGKSVMDVGAGTGLLSFFAAQAGAAKVFSVEVSKMAQVEVAIAESNRFPDTNITILNRAVEEIGGEIGEKVDVLVSEPLGEFLLHERMVESYLHARDRFLRPGGMMFPNVGLLHIAPFSDATMHARYRYLRSGAEGLADPEGLLWRNSSFYGIDLTAAAAFVPSAEPRRQIVLDLTHPDGLLAEAFTRRFDLRTMSAESLQRIEIPFNFEVRADGLVHGVVGWFDALFIGSDATVMLSTAPWCPLTHWWQSHLLMKEPLAVQVGDHVKGKLTMEAEDAHMSYRMHLTMRVAETGAISGPQEFDLYDWTLRPDEDETSNWATFGTESRPVDGRCHNGELLSAGWSKAGILEQGDPAIHSN